MHDRHRKRAIGARAEDEAHIGLFHGRVAIDVDDHDFRTALFSAAHGVSHDIDLGMHRIGAPDDDAVTLGHLLGIDATEQAGAGNVARPGKADADRVVLVGIATHGAQALNAVAMHMAHGSGIEIGPDGLGPMLGFHREEAGGDLVQRLLPGNGLPLPCPFATNPAHGVHQAVWVVDTLGIAGDFFADDAGGVRIVLGAAHPTDAVIGENIDIERADRWTVMRTDGADGAGGGWGVHGRTLDEAGHGGKRIVVMEGTKRGDGAGKYPHLTSP